MSAITIKPIARHHGLFLCLLGSLILTCCLFASYYLWQQARLPLMTTILIAIIILFIGLLKYSEPQHSFILTPEKFIYAHRYGQWQLTWPQISYIKQISETQGFEYHQLPYIGIRLKRLTDIASNISPRLASRLLHEQRPLLAFCLRYQLITLAQATINFDAYITSKNNKGAVKNITITGPVAAFLHHSETLQQALGYHLYIPESALDRDIDNFVSLLKNCHSSSQYYGK
ncbi:MAG: DUF2982 domain-containing protein [Alteromonadaceae bacterium]|nr:DUF2982 domain-containing protein [Alteromonadaceae bacterium]